MATLDKAALTLPKVGLLDQMAQLKTYLAAAKLRLIKSPIAIGPNTVIGDLTAAEADYAGYPAGGVALTWAGPFLDSEGRALIASQRAVFAASDAVTPNTVWGGWVESAGGVLQLAFSMAVGAPLNDALHFLATTIYFNLGIDTFFGYADLEN